MENTRKILLRRGEEQLVLAVNPRDVTIAQQQNTISYTTVLGETVHAARGSGLAQVTLETFLPEERSRFYQGTTPRAALAMLRRWQTRGEPVELLISDSEVSERFLICTLRRTLREGDRDVGVEIGLKEYQYAPAEGEAGETAGGLSAREDGRTVPQTYVTEGGEDLWYVARLWLGDGSRWKELAQINHISDPHRLPAGKELYLQ